MYRRMLALLIILLLLVPAAQAQTYRDIPDCLRIAQTSERTILSASAYQLCYYPDTCQDAVDQELKTLIDDKELREKMSETAYEHYKNKFTAEKMTKQLEAIYEAEFLKRKGK